MYRHHVHASYYMLLIKADIGLVVMYLPYFPHDKARHHYHKLAGQEGEGLVAQCTPSIH